MQPPFSGQRLEIKNRERTELDARCRTFTRAGGFDSKCRRNLAWRGRRVKT